MQLGQLSHFTQIVLQLQDKDDLPPSPSQVSEWGDDGVLLEHVLERAAAVKIDTSAFSALVVGADLSDLRDRLMSFGNALDASNYRLDWEGAGGWLTLLWNYVDVVFQVAGGVDATWNRSVS